MKLLHITILLFALAVIATIVLELDATRALIALIIWSSVAFPGSIILERYVPR